MIRDIRYWLIELLAGSDTIAINLKAAPIGSETMFGSDNFIGGALFCRCHFMDIEIGQNIKPCRAGGK